MELLCIKYNTAKPSVHHYFNIKEEEIKNKDIITQIKSALSRNREIADADSILIDDKIIAGEMDPISFFKENLYVPFKIDGTRFDVLVVK